MSVTANIHIYPEKEMSALDMATLMNASIIGSTVLHGCRVTCSSGKLHMSSGRIVINGRLAVIQGGDFDAPSDAMSSATVNRHLMAVCDLTASSSPFYVKVLSNSEYSRIVSDANETTDTSFNPSSGIKYLDFGTAAIRSGSFTSWTPKSGSFDYKTLKYHKDELEKTITSKESALNTKINNVLDSGNTGNSVATNKSWVNYLKKRSHAVGKFQAETKSTASIKGNANIDIAANGLVTVNFRKERGSRIIVMGSGGGSGAIDMTVAEIFLKPNGSIVDEHGANVMPYTSTKDKYGVPTTINNVDWTPFGIVAVNFSGTNSNNCVVAGMGISGNHAYVKVRNIGSSKASISVAIRVLYICAE